MGDREVLDLRGMVQGGVLYRPPADSDRVEALVPTGCRSNHASYLAELDDGDLLCVWFGGSDEGASDIKVYLSRLGRDQSRWSAPVRLSEPNQRSEQNPFLFITPTGEVWACYTSQETRGVSREEWERQVAAGKASGSFSLQETAAIMRRVSSDGGRTWGRASPIFDRPGSFCRHTVAVLSNGDWLLPMYYSLPSAGRGTDYSVMQVSSDQGETWTEHPVPEARGRVHPSVIEVEPGRLLAFFRSRAADRIYRSRSDDFGRTWTRPERTVLPNNNASVHAIGLADGRIAIIFNCVSANDDPGLTVWPKERYPVTIAISEDGGDTWPYMRHLDTGDNFAGEANKRLNRENSYPCLLQSKDGRLHASYTYAGRQCIKYVSVPVSWVTGEALG